MDIDGANGKAVERLLGCVPGQPRSDRTQVNAEGGEGLPDLIVQFSGKPSALVLLDLGDAVCQRAQQLSRALQRRGRPLMLDDLVLQRAIGCGQLSRSVDHAPLKIVEGLGQLLIRGLSCKALLELLLRNRQANVQ